MQKSAAFTLQVASMVGHQGNGHSPESHVANDRTSPAALAGPCALTVVERLPYGVVFVVSPGRVEYTNRMARVILGAQDGLTLDGNRLRAATAEATARLHDVLIAALGVQPDNEPDAFTIVLERPSGRRRLVVHAVPVDPQAASAQSAVVYVCDPEHAVPAHPALLQTMYGLTNSETNLLLLLVDGLSAKEAAAQLGIGYDTARTRLNSIFDKTGTGRQPELMRLVLLSMPPRII